VCLRPVCLVALAAGVAAGVAAGAGACATAHPPPSAAPAPPLTPVPPPVTPLTPAALAALALANTPPELPSAVHVTDDTARYPVIGLTTVEVGQHLGLGPGTAPDTEYIGSTAAVVEWQFRPHWRHADHDSLCALDHVGVMIRVVTTLPQWLPTSDAAAIVADQWDRFLAAIERHEHGHRTIALHTAATIERALEDVHGRTCDGLPDVANLTARAAWDLGNHRQLAYDTATAHGVSQGARWPPLVPPARPAGTADSTRRHTAGLQRAP
jgi:predicted secreted Zn-dependent protease